jgi:TatD DNase family protein
VTPLENLSVETNAPYLVPLTVRVMAGVRSVDVPTQRRVVSANSERI